MNDRAPISYPIQGGHHYIIYGGIKGIEYVVTFYFVSKMNVGIVWINENSPFICGFSLLN